MLCSKIVRFTTNQNQSITNRFKNELNCPKLPSSPFHQLNIKFLCNQKLPRLQSKASTVKCVLKHFERSFGMYDPERYENNKSAAARDADQFVPLLVQDMTWGQKYENILDYGCGAGSTGAKFFLPQAEKFDSRLYSMDISGDMIAHAKKTYSYPRTSYAVGDVLNDDFPFEGIKFDKIFAVYVLHFVKNYREALKRFYNLLKPGGQLGFTVLTKSTLYMLCEKLGKSDKWGKYMSGYEKYVPEWFEQKEDAEKAFRKTLEGTGFEILKLSTNVQTYNFVQIEVLLDLYLSLNPFVKVIPQELHGDLKQEYREFLTNHWNVKVDSESIETSYELLYAVVQKPLHD